MGFIRERLSMSGRVAVVTGGGRNLGRGMALGLADAGASVVVAEIDEETGPAMERELREAGHEALWLRTNVRDSASIDALRRGNCSSASGGSTRWWRTRAGCSWRPRSTSRATASRRCWTST